MERNEYGDLIARWKVDLIRARAKRFHFRDDEIPDLEQIIVQELLSVDYDPNMPGGAAERTFVISVIDRQLMKIKRDRERDVRRANYKARSIDTDSVFTEKAFFALHYTDKTELRLDINDALIGLSPAERAICKALSEGHSQADIARTTGRSKAAISNEVSKLRKKFRQWGFEDYLAD